ncbi:MAG: hypothetical protein PUC12_17590 [Clostridiales bacterium]|nr:hypothetical protein [Clostridiales bacterium]
MIKKYYYVKGALRVRWMDFLETYGNRFMIKSVNFERKRYAGRKSLSVQQAQEEMIKLIEGKEPFAVGRFGGTEMSVMRAYEFGLETKKEKAMHNLRILSGFYSEDDKAGERFWQLMNDCCKQFDLLGVWYQNAEDYYLKKYMKDCKITQLYNLEPWKSREGTHWSAALRGKKVLVIHPFEETIKAQYAKREVLYPGTDILPEFELHTLKAVQSIGGTADERFKDWFEALDYMFEEAMKIDFEVAIIGCGAYGFPLAARLKEAGKKAIHLGGATQLLFGINGRRWVESPIFAYVRQYMNDAWVYPGESEKPQNANLVEDSCYWETSADKEKEKQE